MRNTFNLIYDQKSILNWLEEIILVFKGNRLNMELIGKGVFFDDCDLLRIKETLVECEKKGLLNITFLNINEIKKGLEDIGRINEPRIFFLEGGDWLEEEKVSEKDEEIRSCVFEVFEIIKDNPIFLCCNTNGYMKTPEKFRSLGYFDRFIKWTKPKMQSIADEFIELTEEKYIDPELLSDKNKLGAILFQNEKSTLRVMKVFSLACKRKALRNKDKCLKATEFFELLMGTSEGQSNIDKLYFEEVALHEAGHAVVEMVESNFEAIPEFVSISQTSTYFGIVFENSLNYQKNMIRSYKDSVREIKMFLAGRAAEELFLGKLHVGVDGASKDLYYASSRAVNLVQNGFLYNYLEKDYVGEDLFVHANWSKKKTSAWVESEAKKIIARCYRETLEILRRNKDLLYRVKKRLMQEKMLTENDLLEIINKDNILNMEKVYAS